MDTTHRTPPGRAAEAPTSRPRSGREWTFLTNHAHVLLCVTADPDVLLRDIALKVGITERAAQLIVTDLEAAGYLTRTRVGRRNHYSVNSRLPLRHALESHRTIQVILDIVAPTSSPASRSPQP
ncbi:MAG: hypothetical protein QG622_2246 [Actinomycetota bacterium]|nr:hypothetical protein [Actinomycetota bacterium]